MKEILDFLLETAKGGLLSIRNIAVIVFPLMVVMQLAKDYKILDRFTGLLKPLTDFFGMSRESSFPLLVGLIFGLSYGAGVIASSAEEGNLSDKDLLLLAVFLGNCHAVFEDTLLFTAIGARGSVLIGIRLAAAVLVTKFIAKKLARQDLACQK